MDTLHALPCGCYHWFWFDILWCYRWVLSLDVLRLSLFPNSFGLSEVTKASECEVTRGFLLGGGGGVRKSQRFSVGGKGGPSFYYQFWLSRIHSRSPPVFILIYTRLFCEFCKYSWYNYNYPTRTPKSATNMCMQLSCVRQTDSWRDSPSKSQKIPSDWLSVMLSIQYLSTTSRQASVDRNAVLWLAVLIYCACISRDLTSRMSSTACRQAAGASTCELTQPCWTLVVPMRMRRMPGPTTWVTPRTPPILPTRWWTSSWTSKRKSGKRSKSGKSSWTSSWTSKNGKHETLSVERVGCCCARHRFIVWLLSYWFFFYSMINI